MSTPVPDLLAALQQSVDAARAARREPAPVRRTPVPEDPTAVRDTEWYGIGFQSQTALLHAYWCEHGRTEDPTTAASIGLPGMIARGNVAETPDGLRLTDRGRQVLAQGQCLGVRL